MVVKRLKHKITLLPKQVLHTMLYALIMQQIKNSKKYPRSHKPRHSQTTTVINSKILFAKKPKNPV